jgi:hypothetical protein
MQGAKATAGFSCVATEAKVGWAALLAV